jgi:hypothetical protein
VLLALCALAFLPTLSGQDKQEVLTDDSIIQMVKAGLEPDIIINAINGQPGDYALGATNLIRLKQAGVPDKVIAAMQAKAGAAQPNTSSRTSASGAQPSKSSGASGRWKFEDKVDPLNGKHSLQAVMTEDVEANGRHGDIQVTATCAPGILQFDLVYASKFDQKTGFKQEDTFLGSRVYMRVKLDDGPVHPTGSGSEYRNEAFVRFADPSSDPVSSLENIAAVGTQAQAFQANIIKVQATLANGDEPVLEMHPQDPEFKSFASRCPASAPAPTAKAAPPPNPSPLRGVPLPASVTRPAVAASTAPAISVDQFASDLPGIVHRELQAKGLDPTLYDKDIPAAVSLIRTCAQITPAMAADLYRAGRFMSTPYKNCNFATDISAASGDPHGNNDLKIKAGDTFMAHDWQTSNEFGIYIWIGPSMVVNNLRIQ